jgi:hypothetical protein
LAVAFFCAIFTKNIYTMANKKRGYIDIQLGGKKRTLHFSMNFWVEFTEQLGVSLTDIGNVFNGGMSLSGIRALIYSAVRANDLEQGNDIDYTLYSVGEWLEELEAEAINDIVAVMMESKILGNSLSDSNAPKKPKPPKAQN